MNKISRRAWFALTLACVLVLGLGWFTIRYFLYADQWVGFTGSPHLYTNGQLDAGIRLVDRNNNQIYSSENGVTYAQRENSRKSVLHLLGDRQGNISPTLLNQYRGELVGYNKFTGTYGMDATDGIGHLTISLEAQRTAYQYLEGYAGCVGVYNYKTGEILCAISTPSFDPDNPPKDVENDPAYDGVYVNRFLHGTYAPGSIFKLLTTYAAIENLADWDERTWSCSGSIELGGHTVYCHSTHGTETLRQALANSCNVAFAQITQELSPKIMTEYVYRARIDSRLSFDGYTTYPGSYDVSDADEFEFAWSGIGQYTDLINPCQYMTFMGAIATGGKAAYPYLMDEITRDDSTSYSASRSSILTDINPLTAKTLKEMMRNNVQTVYGAITLDQPVCAKSGTAEGSENAPPNATFAGFIDSEKYPLAFIVVVEGGGSGSRTAAPIANAVLKACMESMDQKR